MLRWLPMRVHPVVSDVFLVSQLMVHAGTPPVEADECGVVAWSYGHDSLVVDWGRFWQVSHLQRSFADDDWFCSHAIILGIALRSVARPGVTIWAALATGPSGLTRLCPRLRTVGCAPACYHSLRNGGSPCTEEAVNEDLTSNVDS